MYIVNTYKYGHIIETQTFLTFNDAVTFYRACLSSPTYGFGMNMKSVGFPEYKNRRELGLARAV